MAPSRVSGYEESAITYEQLSELEKDFIRAEAEAFRTHIRITKDLYKKRDDLASQIPNFWPLVWEQAPPAVDEYIQPTDAALLLSHLTKLTVRNFEIDGSDDEVTAEADPQSVVFRFEFSENDYFTDTVLEKKFYHRHTRGGWSGLVSDPVKINWKSPDKDLTDGLLGLAHKVWKLEQEVKTASTPEKEGELRMAHNYLESRVEFTPLGGLSFFAWFGYRGRPVSEEENALALERERKRREGATLEPLPKEVEDDEDDWEELYEIFPTGDELAVAIAEDLWPDALKYFTKAQERDPASDEDFESDEDSEEENATKKARV